MPPPAMEAEHLEGYLEKKGGGRSFFGKQKWQKRYFVLDNGTLQYFTNKAEYTDQRAPRKPPISLYVDGDAKPPKVQQAEQSGSFYYFELIVPGRVLSMRSKKRATRDRWSSALAGAIKTYKSKGRRVRSSGAVARVVTPSQLLRRGWVQKHNPKTNVWEYVYAVIDEHRVALHNSPPATPHGAALRSIAWDEAAEEASSTATTMAGGSRCESIPIPECEAASVPAPSFLDFYVFHSTAAWLLRASSEADRDEWVRTIALCKLFHQGRAARRLFESDAYDALKGMETAIRDHRLRARLDAEMDTTRRSATVVSAWRKAQDFTDGAFDWRVPQSILERVQEVAAYAATPALEVSSVAVPVLYQLSLNPSAAPLLAQAGAATALSGLLLVLPAQLVELTLRALQFLACNDECARQMLDDGIVRALALLVARNPRYLHGASHLLCAMLENLNLRASVCEHGGLSAVLNAFTMLWSLLKADDEERLGVVINATTRGRGAAILRNVAAHAAAVAKVQQDLADAMSDSDSDMFTVASMQELSPALARTASSGGASSRPSVVRMDSIHSMGKGGLQPMSSGAGSASAASGGAGSGAGAGAGASTPHVPSTPHSAATSVDGLGSVDRQAPVVLCAAAQPSLRSYTNTLRWQELLEAGYPASTAESVAMSLRSTKGELSQSQILLSPTPSFVANQDTSASSLGDATTATDDGSVPSPPRHASMSWGSSAALNVVEREEAQEFENLLLAASLPFRSGGGSGSAESASTTTTRPPGHMRSQSAATPERGHPQRPSLMPRSVSEDVQAGTTATQASTTEAASGGRRTLNLTLPPPRRRQAGASVNLQVASHSGGDAPAAMQPRRRGATPRRSARSSGSGGSLPPRGPISMLAQPPSSTPRRYARTPSSRSRRRHFFRQDSSQRSFGARRQALRRSVMLRRASDATRSTTSSMRSVRGGGGDAAGDVQRRPSAKAMHLGGTGRLPLEPLITSATRGKGAAWLLAFGGSEGGAGDAASAQASPSPVTASLAHNDSFETMGSSASLGSTASSAQGGATDGGAARWFGVPRHIRALSRLAQERGAAMTLTPLWPDFSRARVHRNSSMPTGDATATDGSDDMRRYLGARGETRSGATLKSGLVWRELARTTGLSGSLLESCGCFVRILNVLETMSVHEPLAEAMCVCEVLPCLQLIHESLQTHTNNQLSALVLSVLENLCAHAQSSALVLTHLHQAKLPIMRYCLAVVDGQHEDRDCFDSAASVLWAIATTVFTQDTAVSFEMFCQGLREMTGGIGEEEGNGDDDDDSAGSDDDEYEDTALPYDYSEDAEARYDAAAARFQEHLASSALASVPSEEAAPPLPLPEREVVAASAAATAAATARSTSGDAGGAHLAHALTLSLHNPEWQPAADAVAAAAVDSQRRRRTLNGSGGARADAAVGHVEEVEEAGEEGSTGVGAAQLLSTPSPSDSDLAAIGVARALQRSTQQPTWRPRKKGWRRFMPFGGKS